MHFNQPAFHVDIGPARSESRLDALSRKYTLKYPFFFLVLTGILLSPVGAICEPAPSGALLSRVIGDVGQATFRLDITERLKKFNVHTAAPTMDHKLRPPNWLPVRTVEIICTTGCPQMVRFTEDVDDVPLGTFRLWDGTSQFVTIWAGATAYWVRIYNVGPNGVEKVLEKATKSAPQFGFAADNSPVVILDNPTSVTVSGSFATRGELWKWDEGRYQTVSGEKH